MEVSKELLSEVLSYKLPYKIKVHKIIVRTGTLNYFYNSKDICGGLFEANAYINIYELAFKCKEWAYTNKYRLSSGQHRLNTKQEHYINNQIASYFCSVYYITNDDSDIQIDANTEIEAIIKACNWVLENYK